VNEPSTTIPLGGPARPAGPSPRPGLRDIVPYTVPRSEVAVRLDANESPYPPPPGFLGELAAEVRRLELNRYPDREAVALRSALAERAGRPTEGVWVANGSNEVIQQLLLAYGGPGRRALVFEPTYALHADLARVTHTEVARVSVRPPFVLARGDLDAAVASRPDVVFVCSPNNPTGQARPPGLVADLARRLPDALVVVDEAYIEFGGTSALGLVDATPNVAIVRTFSKAFAMAGVRLGYCLAQGDVVDDLRRVRLPYHVSAFTQATGRVALRWTRDASDAILAIRRQRDRIVRELDLMAGVTVFASDANFVLFRPPASAPAVRAGLLGLGIGVRDVAAAGPGGRRAPPATPSETEAFLHALREVLVTATNEEEAIP
jgi:histidinol-phosphate aminotransferase